MVAGRFPIIINIGFVGDSKHQDAAAVQGFFSRIERFSHAREDIPWGKLKASNGTLKLELPEAWLSAHPLTQADLATEIDYLREKDRRLEIAAR